MDKAQPIQIMTYYQSTIRNIGLYTSVSFGTLAISRYYRDKIWSINLLLLIISMILISITIIIINNLRIDINNYTNLEKNATIDKWMIIPNIMECINYVLILIALYVAYLQF